MFVHWDLENIDHVGKHGVKPEEADYVVLHASAPYPEDAGQGKYRVWGKTVEGRFLQVIFVYRPVDTVELADVSPHKRFELEECDEVVYIIHARDLTIDEKRQLRRKRT